MDHVVIDNLVNDVYIIIENMVSVYDVEHTSLKDFLRDVKQCHALHTFIYSNLTR